MLTKFCEWKREFSGNPAGKKKSLCRLRHIVNIFPGENGVMGKLLSRHLSTALKSICSGSFYYLMYTVAIGKQNEQTGAAGGPPPPFFISAIHLLKFGRLFVVLHPYWEFDRLTNVYPCPESPAFLPLSHPVSFSLSFLRICWPEH